MFVNIVSPIKLRIKFKKMKEFVKVSTRTNNPIKSFGQNSGLRLLRDCYCTILLAIL